MAVTVDELFDIRDELIGLSSITPLNSWPEGVRRMVVARTYYCVYHYALAIASDASYVEPSSGSVHKELWGFFRKRSNPKYKKIGHWGTDLHHMRTAADYDISEPFNITVGDALDLAADIVDRLNEFDVDTSQNKS